MGRMRSRPLGRRPSSCGGARWGLEGDGPWGEAEEASSRESHEGGFSGQMGRGRGRAGGWALSTCMDSGSATADVTHPH